MTNYREIEYERVEKKGQCLGVLTTRRVLDCFAASFVVGITFTMDLSLLR